MTTWRSSSLAVLASFAMAASAHAAVGAGNIGGSIVSSNVQSGQKAMGKFKAKPADSKPGKVWTGGGTTSLKFNPDVGNPLKPGLATGTYVMVVETSASPGTLSDVQTFAQFTYDAATKKCTIAVHPDADTGSSLCGGVGQPLCAPAAVGKCTATQYQIAGPIFSTAIFGGQGAATRLTFRTLPTPAGCPTGTIVLGGAQLYPPPVGPPSHTCLDGLPVAGAGFTFGTPCNSGEGACP